MKRDKICMFCGTKFNKLKIRVLQNTEDNIRDFCSFDCLIKYVKGVQK